MSQSNSYIFHVVIYDNNTLIPKTNIYASYNNLKDAGKSALNICAALFGIDNTAILDKNETNIDCYLGYKNINNNTIVAIIKVPQSQKYTIDNISSSLPDEIPSYRNY